HPESDAPESTEIRAFLIADVRGYTLFTQERGDEAAAKLAAKFARLAREAVEARNGSVIELRGDEALAVFASPRQAIRAAVEMQDRFVDETLDDPSLPLTVGIGLDAGEAVPVEGGYRGGALNQAARLCGQAGPGEVLASREITHLARHVDGVDYADRGDVRMKGLTEPVRVIAVTSTERPAPPRLEPIAAERKAAADAAGPGDAPRRRGWVRRHRLLAASIAVVVVAAAVAVPLVLGGGSGGLASLPPNSIGRIDPATGHIVGAIGLDLAPGAVTAGDGAVWVANPNDGRITRIDPATGDVAGTIAVPGAPSSIAASGGLVWVADETGPSVNRVSPQTDAVVGAPTTVGNGPASVAVGFGSVWVANRLDGSVTRLDEHDGTVQRTIEVGESPTAIAMGAGGVWVADAGGDRVFEISAATNAPEQSVPVGSDPEALAVGAGGVWVANAQSGTVSRIDPETAGVAETIPVGQGPSSIAITGSTVWVTNRFDGTVSRIDGSAGASRQPETVPTQSSPVGSAVVGGQVWVAVQGAATSHRGGTLRVVASSGFAAPILDPQAYAIQTWQALIMTNDGLLAFQRVGGGDGATVVADLATALPTVTSGDTVYTLHVRSGLEYSNGVPVRASDIERGIERGYQVPQIFGSTGPPAIAEYYDVIVGGAACRRAFEANPGTATCDLSRGIVTDDDAGTIVFHLVRPDPDFPQKLAMPFADAVPPGTPMRTALTQPLPATGPYLITAYDPKSGMTLVRNPRFRPWSEAAQPDGFPDEIRYTFGMSPADQVRAVEAGTADTMLDPPPADQLSTLTTRYAGRVHPYLQASTFYVALNTTMPPFDNEDARRAVSYAFDRGATLTIQGGQQAGRVTCQFLPPDFPGYRPYCPYTVDPNPETGAWSDPDVEKANQLVARSGTSGADVEVWTPGYTKRFGPYVVRLLDSLGYHATLHGAGGYFTKAYPPGPGVQVAIDGWIQDYPSADNFLSLMECGRAENLARLCDPRVEAALTKARAAQTSRPELASALWADVDHLAVDLAAQVDFVNAAGIDFLSTRVGNAQHNPQWGLLFDQMWVR
ncbi:MAG TPA: ABC transporter substrate-binding protein, partial [Actinomycetota bacterium]|nr:ABC transporter substrate-binding protein [Actinomycetota bacterium]